MLRPEVARSDDASALLALRDDAAEWMGRRGFCGWVPGEMALSTIVEQIKLREWHVHRDSAVPVAAVRVILNDEIWGQRPEEAIYVHGLVVHRRYVGQGLGRELLAWVERRAAMAGRHCVRLDCAEANAGLRGYYRAAGYREVGRREFDAPLSSATLLEKPL